MNYGVRIMIDHLHSLLTSMPYELLITFGEFIRSLEFSFAAIGSKVMAIFEYYIYVHGWKAVLVIIIVMYVILMSFSVTRGFASLALNTIFSQPFNLARDLTKGLASGIGGGFKFIVSAIRDSRNDN